MNPLRMISIYKSFKQGGRTAEVLKGVSLSAEAGEFIAIMGPSGSGKSTLLHIAAGLTAPDSGVVEIDGLSIRNLGDGALTELRRRKLGFVFQAFNLIPTLNAEDNILLPMLADRKRPARGELDRLCTRLGITEILKRMPAGLSGGEQQRVAIARALLPNPSLILADEPTGSLDSAAGQELCALLRSFRETENRTILMVTHEPAAALWADRVLVLRDGKFAGEIRRDAMKTAHDLSEAYQDLLGGVRREA